MELKLQLFEVGKRSKTENPQYWKLTPTTLHSEVVWKSALKDNKMSTPDK